MSSSRKLALRSPRPKGVGSRSPDTEQSEGEGAVEGSAGQLLDADPRSRNPERREGATEGTPRPAGLRITLVKSPTGYSEQQKRTVRALGLRHLRQTVEQVDTPAVRGMIAKIPHLVSVEPALRSPRPKEAGSGAERDAK